MWLWVIRQRLEQPDLATSAELWGPTFCRRHSRILCLFTSPGSFPSTGVDPQHGRHPRCQVDEAAVIADFPVAERRASKAMACWAT